MIFINNLKTSTGAFDIRNFIHFATGGSRSAKSHKLQDAYAVSSTNLLVAIFTFRDFPEFGMHYTPIIIVIFIHVQ